MANNHASGTFEPLIPSDLITPEFETLADALGVTVNRPNDDGKEVYLFNEGYCTSGYIEKEDGTEKEVTDEDLYAAIQDIIRRSEGRLTWVSHEQAYTCDKMRAGEFGGSAVFITADDIQYHGTSSWLERRIHEAETGDTGPDTEDTTVNTNDVIEATNDLINAAKLVVERWSTGDLAQAVNNLAVTAGWAEKTLEDYEPAVAPPPNAFAIYRKAYGHLHDMLSDCIEGCRLSEADIPDDYQAIVYQLCGPCMEADQLVRQLENGDARVAPQPDINKELLAALTLLYDTGTDSSMWPYAMSRASKAIARAKSADQVERALRQRG